jgi:hypothetical protein
MYSFLRDIQKEWDVEDEGEMVDTLGIQIRRHDDGSITLHQEKYVHKLVKEFLPEGVPKVIVGEASHFKPAGGGCNHPELLEPYQRRLGSLMYLANSTRPDIAWTIGMHCRNMSSPTPELLAELNYCFVY